MRLPSGAIAAPCGTSISSITPTTWLVAGSMTWILSPAEFVWRTRAASAAVAEVSPDTQAARDLPLGILLRLPVLSAAMEAVAACCLRQGMQQHAAFHWLSGYNELFPDSKVLSRLLLVPRSLPGGERLQRRAAVLVTDYTPRVARPLAKENGLNAFLKELHNPKWAQATGWAQALAASSSAGSAALSSGSESITPGNSRRDPTHRAETRACKRGLHVSKSPLISRKLTALAPWAEANS